MQLAHATRTFALLTCIAVSALFLMPLAASAQTSDLKATIRAELLKDPRTTSLTVAQLEAMVELLSGEAQEQGMTPSDIAWRPASFSQQVTDVCGATPQVLCIFGVALGFIGSDPTIPYILGAASMALVWILAEMIHRRRYPAPSQSAPVQTSQDAAALYR